MKSLSTIAFLFITFTLTACQHELFSNQETVEMLEPESITLVNLAEVDPDLIIEAIYATPNNFVGVTFYPENKLFIVPEVGEQLKKVNQYLLDDHNLRLKVWDAYRPLQVQKKMWEIMPDPNYVADPKKGSRHNRGCAVDVTLVDMEGNELAMPTGYDDFSKQAHWDYHDLPVEVLKNRAILKGAMEKFGFISLASEWWHYDYDGWQRYPVLDRNPYDEPLFPEMG